MNADVARKTIEAKPATDVISQKQTTNGNSQVATSHHTEDRAHRPEMTDSIRSSGDRTHSDDASAHSGEGHSPGKPTGVVSAASGGKPTGTESTAQRVGQQPGSPAGLELNDDEKKLLGEVAKGLTVKKIAMRRVCDEERVRQHVEALCGRLGVSDVSHAVLAACTLGLLAPEKGGREV